MNSVFSYTDYRKYLYDWYCHQKELKTGITLKDIAKDVGFKSPGNFTMIVKGQTNIGPELIDGFIALIKMRKREASYFRHMVLYNQASNYELKKEHFQAMASFSKSTITTVDSKHYALYDRWYHQVIRALLEFYPVKENFEQLAQMLVPEITPRQAQKSIELLHELGFVQKDSDGCWRPLNTIISTGYETEPMLFSALHASSLQLAGDALTRFSRDERNLSNMTLGVSKKTAGLIQDEIRNFRKKILSLVEQDPAEIVYQMSIQFFPTTKYHKRQDCE
jgi:uncharacterized protein (TIGR02147 family)